MNDKQKLTVVVGPTASGKTGLSLKIAKEIGAEIISADSRMVYRGLDIGTGKPTWEYRQLDHSPWITPIDNTVQGPIYEIDDVRHHLIDIVEPEQPYSLSEWLDAARELITKIQKNDTPVVIVGGTSLYAKALVDGFQLPPTDSVIRSELEMIPKEQLLSELKLVDPVTANREKDNHRRIIRAMEVYKITGIPISQRNNLPLENVEIVHPTIDRTQLFERIDQRINERIEAGMIDEVKNLISSGVSKEWLTSLGLEYRVIPEWLESDGEDIEALKNQLRGTIHGYARRQITYLKNQMGLKNLQ